VQGVGFRPFIYRLAVKHGLHGHVENRSDGVTVIVQGDPKAVKLFTREIHKNAPPASCIKSVKVIPKAIERYDQFSIAGSKVIDDQITEISPDIAVCEECMNDMATDAARIYYPFINCTNCGPRFTIIQGVPYDRARTTMKDFLMCRKCQSEYNDILDRRFHAQPIACNNCGPEYILSINGKTISDKEVILTEIASSISAGQTVAIKGLGGYHLMCDAYSDDAVIRLRKRKQREAKPFAVMFGDFAELNKYCYVNENEEKELTSWRRPIVILKQKMPLASSVSNGLDTIGAMLPYMPFHYLMFRFLKTTAVVLTSGNLSEEPLIINDARAEQQLMTVADALVSYNREIFNRADDSVIRSINGKASIIRRSRGFVPRSVDLHSNVEGIIAMGGEQKNTFCIGRNFQAIMSQHIGDLKNIPSFEFYKESISRFSEMFRFKPAFIACDLHPDYFSTGYAFLLEKELNIPLISVQHHHAHVVSCMAEHKLEEKVIGISLDGTGFGTDGNIWGSEFLITDSRSFTRYTHFDYIPMPGGDRVVDEPWRMALSYLLKYFGDTFDFNSLPLFRSIGREKFILVKEMIENGINSPLSSGAGRLFDAVSALLGICPVSSFDSEAPIRLESVIKTETDLFYPFTMDKSIIFAETFKAILNDMPQYDASFISAKFHNTISQIILEVSEKIRGETSIDRIVLSGGVFQNKYLLEKSIEKLEENRFKVYTNEQVPSNDGGISLGQLIVASKTFGVCV